MSQYFHVVPWFNSEEWHAVYQKIFSESANIDSQKKALEELSIWKARCPSIPSGIESTLILLEVYIQDKVNNHNSESFLRLAHSSAVMRFVNHVLDSESVKGVSLYNAAKNLNVPDWIIDLRHDTAHSFKLPSIHMLREATLIGLEWLKTNYWNKYSNYISDYVSGQRDVDYVDDKVESLMNLCLILSICLSCNYKSLNMLPDENIKSCILHDFQQLYDKGVLANEDIKITTLYKSIQRQCENIILHKNVNNTVYKSLLSENSLFLSLELVYSLCENFEHMQELNWNYVKLFEMLLTFLHSNDLLFDFVLQLIEETKNSENEESKQLLAALWVKEILGALKRNQLFFNRRKLLQFDDINSKTRDETKMLFHHWYPNVEIDALFLDFKKNVPVEFTNINQIYPILSDYNPYLNVFVRHLLDLLDPQLSKEVVSNISKLTSLISSPEATTQHFKIFTLDDVTRSNQESSGNAQKNCDNTENDLVMETNISNHHISKAWKLASNDHDWRNCQIGTIPLNNK